MNPGLAALAAGVSLAALTVGAAQPAFAGDECGPDSGGVAVCTPASGVGNPYPNGINYVGDPAEDITVVLQGGLPGQAVQVSTGGYGVVVENSPGQDATVQAASGVVIDATGNGVDVTALNGGLAGVYTSAAIYSGAVAISVDSQGGGLGSRAVVVNEADLFAAGDSTEKLDTAGGIVVHADGSAVVYSTGDIVVTSTSDSEATGIGATSTLSYAFVESYGDLTVYNTGGAAFGIVVSGATDADVLSDGEVRIYGDQIAVGLSAESSAGPANVEAYGDVSVFAVEGIGTGVNGASDRGDVTLSVVGDVYAGGHYGGIGLRAEAAGDASVTVDGDVSAGASYGYAVGVYLQADGLGDVYIDGSVLAEAAGAAYGVFAHGQALDIDITGSVTAYSRDNQAIGVLASADGDVAVDVDGVVRVTSLAAGVYGVAAESAYGAAYVYLTGGVQTTGAGGAAVYATAQTGASVISTGSIVASGTDGVVVRSQQGSAYAQVVDVSTDADHAAAVDVQNVYGYAIAVAFGDIVTTGDYSDGLFAQSTYNSAYATSGGYVSTSGQGSAGIRVASTYGDAWITNHGAVTTFGDNAGGLSAGTVYGDVTLMNNGAVATFGSGSEGLSADTQWGMANLYGSGTVETSGDGATGIQASGYLGVNLVMSGAEVETWGYQAGGVNAFSIGGEVGVYIGIVETHGDQSAGIAAVSQGPSLADGVDLSAGFVRTYGDESDGVSAFAQMGDVHADVGTVITYGASSQGVAASAAGGGYLNEGAVYVDFNSVRTYGDQIYLGSFALDGGGFGLQWGQPSEAVNAYSVNGPVFVTGDDVLTTGIGATGVWASGVGEVSIQVTEVTTQGDAPLIGFSPTQNYYGSGAIGIDGRVRGGDLSIVAGTVRTSGDYAEGIRTHAFALEAGGGALWGQTYIQAQHVYTSGDHSDGIQATSFAGTIGITGYNVVTYGDWSDGVEATAYTYVLPGGSVVLGAAEVDTHAVHTYGEHANGFDVTTWGGDASADIYFATTFGNYSTAAFLRAYTFFGSNGGTASGDIDATVSYVSTLGVYSRGIDAYAQGGDVSVFSEFVYTGGNFSPAVTAIAADGRVDITVNSILTEGINSDGLRASSNGAEAYVDVGAVRVYGADSDAVTIYAEGTAGEIHLGTRGFVYALDGTGVIASADAYSLIHVDDGSEVRGKDAGIVSQTGTGTFINIDMGGTVTGLVGAAIDANGAAAVIHNDGHLNGFVDLTGQNDTLLNYGTWEARATSAFGLGADQVSNYGTVFFRGVANTGTTTTISGLETFTNRSLVSGVDSSVNDVLAMSSTLFNGAKGSQLGLNVQFGGSGSAADRLVIARAAGVTKIVPTSTLAQQPGALNLGGILVVDSAYASQTGAEFTMNAVPMGLVTYSLKFDAPSDNWLIVGLPSKGAGLVVNLPPVNPVIPGPRPGGSGGHLAELRGGPVGGYALGFSEADETRVDIGGLRFWSRSEDDVLGETLQFGVDRREGDMVWGATSGYLRQQSEAGDGAGRFDVEGLSAGAYAAWASNGWFGDLGATAAFRSIDARLAGAGALDPVRAMSWSLQGEAGYRLEHENGGFVEPVVSLAWSSARVDDLVAGPTRLDFGSGASLAARTGVRVGWTLSGDHMVLAPTLGLYRVDVLAAPERARLISGDERAWVGDPDAGGYGVAEFGAVLRTDWGVEGFVSGAWSLAGDGNGDSARVGVRWRW